MGGDNKTSAKRLEMLVEAVKLLKTTPEFYFEGSKLAYYSIRRLEIGGFELDWILKSIKEGKKKRLKMCSKKKCSELFYYEPENSARYEDGTRAPAKIQKFCPDCAARIYAPRLDDPSDISSPPIQYGAQLSYGFRLLVLKGDDEFGFYYADYDDDWGYNVY